MFNKSRPKEAQSAVVTGIGILNSLGSDRQDFFEKVFGAAQASHTKSNKTGAYQIGNVQSAGIQRAFLKKLPPASQFACIAAEEALQDAALSSCDPARTAVIIAGPTSGTDFNYEPHLYPDMDSKVQSKDLLELLVASPACSIARHINSRGYTRNLSGSNQGSLDAVLEAAHLIHSQQADLVLAGGSDTLKNSKLLEALKAAGMISGDDELQLGEGAAVFCIESKQQALARGAHIYTEIPTQFLSDISRSLRTTILPDSAGSSLLATLDNRLLDNKSKPDLIVGTQKLNQSHSNQEKSILKNYSGFNLADIPQFNLNDLTGHLFFSGGAMHLAVSIAAIQRGQIAPELLQISGSRKTDSKIRSMLVLDQNLCGNYQSILVQ